MRESSENFHKFEANSFLYLTRICGNLRRFYSFCSRQTNCKQTHMITKKFTVLVILLMSSWLCLASSSKLLQVINQKISSINIDLSDKQNQKTKFENELEQMEQKTAVFSKQLHKTSEQLDLQNHQLNSLEHLQESYEKKLAAEKRLIVEEIQGAAVFSRQPYLKVLLTEENPSSFARMLMYYHYFYQYHTQTIGNIELDLRHIQINQSQIKEQMTNLNTLKQQQQQEKNQLQSMQLDRNNLLHTINSTIKNEHNKLKLLTQNKEHLEETLTHLIQNERYESFPTNADFTKLEGRLPWPTHGTIINSFGESIDQSELRSNGVVIKAIEGQPVYSIANGTVVFAKWMAGYGLLMIVNHGNGYMSLYGRNQALYKKAGDQVRAGEQIGSVGETGGFEYPSLYFAIRYNAKPLNPTDWCKGRA
jgi:septal ring factor EnvC (AmiA/AmiB activator)